MANEEIQFLLIFQGSFYWLLLFTYMVFVSPIGCLVTTGIKRIDWYEIARKLFLRLNILFYFYNKVI